MEAPPDWDALIDGFTNAPPGRSDAWRTTGSWALERLREHLGEHWPRRTFERHRALPADIAWSATHVVACANMIELALRLMLLSGCDGFADARRPLLRDAREESYQHVCLQLEVGGLGISAGHDVRFEPPVPESKKNADVEIAVQGGERIVVETQVQLAAERARATDDFSAATFPRIQEAARRHGAVCGGDLGRVLSEDEAAELLEAVEAYARLLAAGGVAPALNLHGARLQLRAQADELERSLGGPQHTGDLWPRMAGLLVKKAKQTVGADNVWVRVSALQGLWLLSTWARADMPTKLRTLSQNVRAALSPYPHVSGVVIGTSCDLARGKFNDETYEELHGGVAIRRAIRPARVRETMVIPTATDRDPVIASQPWRDLYAEESPWLDTALARFDLPSVDEIFSLADRGVA